LAIIKWVVRRPSVLPQVGPAERPGRLRRRPQGLPQMRHQCHRKGRLGQSAAQERKGRGRHRGVSFFIHFRFLVKTERKSFYICVCILIK